MMRVKYHICSYENAFNKNYHTPTKFQNVLSALSLPLLPGCATESCLAQLVAYYTQCNSDDDDDGQ